MKRIISTIAALIIACLSLEAKNAPETITPASDSRITFVGRTLKEDGNVSFDWSGVYARIKFEGQYIAIRVSDSQKNYYNVWLDKNTSESPDKIIRTAGKDSLIVLFNESDIKALYGKNIPKSHNLIIEKRTEGSQGRTTIHSFITKGTVLQAEGLKERQIEFIGDSYTCGYGSENSIRTDQFTPETENSNLSYAPIVARFFDADYNIIAHSGIGIARNYNDGEKDTHMPERYLQTFDMDKSSRWDAKTSDFKPQITVIYLGTNDFSVRKQPTLASFKENYIKLMKSIKGNYGQGHPILCIGSRIDELTYDYLKEIAHTCGLENISYLVLSDKVHNNDSDLGASWHPNYKGHIKKALAVIPYIATITNWEIEAKAVK